MRPTRKKDEAWAISELLDHLNQAEPGWKEDTDFTDNPDLVLENSDGIRVACELSTVSLNEWYRWKNDPSLKLDTDKLDRFIVPREPHIWLRNIINDKNPKLPTYLNSSNSSKGWLIIHGPELEPYDLLALDIEYDVPLLQGEAAKTSHNFERIYAVSSSAKKVLQIYPGNPLIKPIPEPIRGTLKQLELRLVQVQLGHGSTPVRIGSDVQPDRQTVLPPLGIYY